jgi:hypothetical protein
MYDRQGFFSDQSQNFSDFVEDDGMRKTVKFDFS